MLTNTDPAPAEKRLQELCTNGLFLNLFDAPEPLRSGYAHIREQIRDLHYGGACTALLDMAKLCVCLTRALLLSRHPSPLSIALFNRPQALLNALKDLPEDALDETAFRFFSAYNDAYTTFLTGTFADWADRDNASCLYELNNADAASMLITQLSVLNDFLHRNFELFSHLRNTTVDGKAVFVLDDVETVAFPYIQIKDNDYWVCESIDAFSGKYLMRAQMSHMIAVFPATDPDIEVLPPQDLAQPLAKLVPPFLHAEYVRPIYWDRWLLEGLRKKDRGYMVLEAEEGMGKSVYASMLDPKSPYYEALPAFENIRVYRYTISLYPDTQRPSLFCAALSSLCRAVPSVTFTANIADCRRRIARFLNDVAETEPTAQHLFILDGIQLLEYDDEDLGILTILPAESALLDGVYVMLLDRPHGHAVVAARLLTSNPYETVFQKSDLGYQHMLRRYLAQYVLHMKEDAAPVEALCQAVGDDFAAAHMLRETYSLCRESTAESAANFFAAHPSLPDLTELYLDRLRSLYSESYAAQLDCIVEMFLMNPHPLSAADILSGALDEPSSLWMMVRDLRPLLAFVDADRIGFTSEAMHFMLLRFYAGDWKCYAERLLSLRRDRLSEADLVKALRAQSTELLPLVSDLDYYAGSVGWPGHARVLTELGQALLPLAQCDALPQCIVDYFLMLNTLHADDRQNPFSLASLDVMSLSAEENDRRLALNHWDSLRDTPQFDLDAFARAQDRYLKVIEKQNPLSQTTIDALVALRRKTQMLYDDSLVWQTQKLSTGRLAQAVLDESAFSDNDDPCNLSRTRQTLDHALSFLEESTGCQPEGRGVFILQNAALAAKILIPFTETLLRALLPVLCKRDCAEAAARCYDEFAAKLNRLYRLHAQVCDAIAAYDDELHPEEDYRQPLEHVDELEAKRSALLLTWPRLWLSTFTDKQLLQFFDEQSTLWRTEEAMLRYDGVHAAETDFSEFSLKNIRERVEETDPNKALALVSRWNDYAVCELCASKSPISASRANDLCEIEMLRASLAEKTGRAQLLHQCVARLLFFLNEGELSSKHVADVISALSDRLAADRLGEYTDASELVNLFGAFSSKLNKSHAILSAKQISAVSDHLHDSFPKCLETLRFYPYLIKATAKNIITTYGPGTCKEKMNSANPLEALAFAHSFMSLAPNKDTARADVLRMVESWLDQADALDDSLVDYLTSFAISLGSTRSFAEIFYRRWRARDREAFVEIRLDMPDRKLLYRRLASCYVAQNAAIDVEETWHTIMARETEKIGQAFALLAVAVTLGAENIAAADWLATQGLALLADESAPLGIQVECEPIALELAKVRLMAVCMDEGLCPQELEGRLSLCKRLGARVGRPLRKWPLRAYARLWQPRLSRQLPDQP